jgi:hypothetical protein
MQERTFVSAQAFCIHHHIELSFIHSLHSYGLLDVTAADDDYLLPHDQLEALEKMVRMHYDLHINLEGIDAINHLLQRVETMQQELRSLQNRLQLYEKYEE